MRIDVRRHIDLNRPASGFLVHHSKPERWFMELANLGLTLDDVMLYPLPGPTPNSVWGCYIQPHDAVVLNRPMVHEKCYRRSKSLILPISGLEYPKLNQNEIEELMQGQLHLLHPGIGLFELTEPIDLEGLLEIPLEHIPETIRPEERPAFTKEVYSLSIASKSEEEILAELEEAAFPKKKKEDTSLSLKDKIKLWFYRLIFKADKNPESRKVKARKKKGLTLIEKVLGLLGFDVNRVTEKHLESYEDLEKRNQTEVNKLLDMLENNPDLALEYALPLDTSSASRTNDAHPASYTFSKIWSSLGTFLGNPSNTNGRTVVLQEEQYETLRRKYLDTAEALKKQGKYEKAAFVYLKLLKDKNQAAVALEDGGFHKEAGALYEQVPNKIKAGHCYAKANMHEKAAELFKSIELFEEAGDMYMRLNKKSDAERMFQLATESLTNNDQYVKAAKLVKTKLHDHAKGQELLLEGWRKQKDAFNCLTYYFNEIQEPDVINKEVHTLYANEIRTSTKNVKLEFLSSIGYVYANHQIEEIKDLAYTIVSEHIDQDPMFTSYLKKFNPDDKELAKDGIRYRARKRKKK